MDAAYAFLSQLLFGRDDYDGDAGAGAGAGGDGDGDDNADEEESLHLRCVGHRWQDTSPFRLRA